MAALFGPIEVGAMKTGNHRSGGAPHVTLSTAVTEQDIGRVELAVRQYCRWMIKAYLDEAKGQTKTLDGIDAISDLNISQDRPFLEILK